MVESGRSAAVASQLVGRALEGERAIAVDQTNHSVVVAETVVVKWLQPPVPSPHPGVDLLRYLAARGFAHMPGFVGVYEVDDMVLAVVTEFVPGALDGWDWYVDDVDAWLRGELEFDVLVESAREMGDITSQLHDALSGLQRSAVSVRAYHAQADSMLQQAMRLVDGDEGHRLRSLERSVRVALEPLRDERQIPAHRIHGDLHAGQFLRVGSGANASRQLLTDFDGNPLAEPAERRLAQSPLRDLAGLLQSIDHVGRIVVKRRHPDRRRDVDTFIDAAVAAALGAYSAHHAVDDAIVRALRVAQELHEYCYAATHLPKWMYVPDEALPAVLARR